LIESNGLGQFYDLQEGATPPVKSLVFQPRDYAWLETLAATVEGDGAPRLKVDLQGLSCVACAWLVERVAARCPGVLTARVDPNLGTLELQWERGAFHAADFARELQGYGYLLGPPGDKERRGDRALLLRLGVCGALTMNTMLFSLPGYLGMSPDFEFAELFRQCAFVLGTLSFFIGGSWFFKHAWQALRQRVLHLDLPIALGLAAAYGGSVYASLHGLREYHDAYGSFPPGADAKEGEDLTYPEDNKLLFDSLCAVDGAKTKGNPKGTVFFKPSDPIPFAKKSHFDSTGKFLDGWGHPFRVRVDANGDGKIANPFKTGAGPASIEEKAIAWSMGPTTFPGRNGETDGTGRVCSWENPDTQKKPTTPKPNDDHEPLENEK
jgi:hypothetical protein